MDNGERSMFLSWAHLPQFRAKVEQAKQIVRSALLVAAENGIDPYVACSWGTDSINLVHLTQSIEPDVLVIHDGCKNQDAQDNYSETECRYFAIRKTNYLRVETNGKDRQFFPLIPTTCRMGLIGCRAEENKHRKFAIRKYGYIYQYTSGTKKGHYRAFPLAWWNWRDKWAYTVYHGLPWLNAYDHPSSGSRETSRTSVFHDPKNAELKHIGGYKTLSRLKARLPEIFAEMCEGNPSIRDRV